MGIKRTFGWTLSAIALVLGLHGCSMLKVVSQDARAKTSQTTKEQVQISDFVRSVNSSSYYKFSYPLESNEEVNDFLRAITKRGKTERDKAKRLYDFICDNKFVGPSEKLTVIETADAKIIKYKAGFVPKRLTVIEIIEQYLKDREKLEDEARLKVDCVSQTGILVVGLRNEGIKAYFYNVKVDCFGNNVLDDMADDPYAKGHCCAKVVFSDGTDMLIDCSADENDEGFDIKHQQGIVWDEKALMTEYILGILARSYSMTQHTKVGILEKVNELYPNNIFVVTSLSKLYIALSDFSENLKELEAEKARLDKALAYALKAVELEKNYFTLECLASVYYELKDYPKTEQLINESLALNPHFPEARWIHYNLMISLKRPKQAKTMLDKLHESEQVNDQQYELRLKDLDALITQN